MKCKRNFGYWSTLISSNLIDIGINAGFDFVIFDMEHGFHNINSIFNSTLLLKKSKCKSYVRIPQNGFSLIQRLNDIGIDGILFPMLHNKNDILRARNETLIQPEGKLGFNPFVSKYKYSNSGEKNSLKCIGMIEDFELFESALNFYLDFGFDGCYLGAYDMNIKAGYQGDLKNKDYLKKLAFCSKMLQTYETNLETFGMDISNSEQNFSEDLGVPKFLNTCLFVDSGSIFNTWSINIEKKK